MSLNLNKFLNTISSLNESINILVEDGIIVTPSSVEKIEITYIIHKNETDFPNDDGNYITEKEAQTYDINKKAGDTIIIEEVDMSKMSDAEMFAWFKENDISTEQAGEMALVGTSSKGYRMGGKVYRFGKSAGVAIVTLKALRKTKDLPHSVCWCAKLFEKHQDADGKRDKPQYENYLNAEGYIDSIVDNFMKNWDKCESQHGKKIRNKVNRDNMLSNCVSVEDWYGDAEEVLNSIISKLQTYYNVTGVNVKKKELKGGVDQSVGDFIGKFKKIWINFTRDCECHMNIPQCNNGTGFTLGTAAGNEKMFRIIEHKIGKDTVTLQGPGGASSKKWVFSFSKKGLNVEQSGSLYVWDNSGSHTSVGTGWQGKITKLEN